MLGHANAFEDNFTSVFKLKWPPFNEDTCTLSLPLQRTTQSFVKIDVEHTLYSLLNLTSSLTQK